MILFVVTTSDSYTTFKFNTMLNHANSMLSMRMLLLNNQVKLADMCMLLLNEQVKLADLDASKEPAPSYITLSRNTILETIAEKHSLDEDAIMHDLERAIT